MKSGRIRIDRKNNRIKKVVSLVIALALSLTACGESLIPLIDGASDADAQESSTVPETEVIYVETGQASEEKEEEPEPLYADRVTCEPAGYSETLIRRNTATWAIQNAVCSEQGEYQRIGAAVTAVLLRRIDERVPTTEIPLILPWTLPEEEQPPLEAVLLSEEEGAPGITGRELLTEVYHRWIPETEALLIPDETLESFASAMRLVPEEERSDGKTFSLQNEASSQMISRALYFIDGGEEELRDHLMRMPYFYQGIGFFDGLTWRHWTWGGVTFDINGHTMTEAGCGFFAAAMAMSYLEEHVIEPVEFKENGEYTGNGAAHTVGEHSAQQYGIPAHRTDRFEEAEEALRNGYPVMVLEQGPSRWANTGHFILLAGIAEDGTLGVYNPGSAPHQMYAVKDYGMFTAEDILEHVNPDLPFTIFGIG